MEKLLKGINQNPNSQYKAVEVGHLSSYFCLSISSLITTIDSEK